MEDNMETLLIRETIKEDKTIQEEEIEVETEGKNGETEMILENAEMTEVDLEIEMIPCLLEAFPTVPLKMT